MTEGLVPGLVSVVLVNFRGADDTITAIQELGKLDWPADRLEIVVVENASGDDSAARIRAAAPEVVLVESAANGGFTAGCNQGVAASHGEFVAFLNNDAKPDPAWVRAAVDRFAESPRIGAVASRVLDWEGTRIDYVDAALTWYGMGYKPFTGEPVLRRELPARDVLFGTGSAMFVRREVFDALGGFDERFFMFYEDVDLGWRLNLRGWRFAYEPDSLVFHKHHQSMQSYGGHKEQFLLERNALFTLYKNLGEQGLAETLPAALLLAVRRGLTRPGLDGAPPSIDTGEYDLRAGGPNDPGPQPFPKSSIAVTYALDQFLEALPSLSASREEIQRSRTVSDEALWPLFGRADNPVTEEPRYVDGYQRVTSAFGVTAPTPARRVVIVTGDPIGARLAGPAIRAWHMARLLCREHEVTLVSLTGVEEGVSAPFDIRHIAPGDDRSFGRLEQAAEVIIFQGHAMEVFGTLARSDKVLVVDVYDPMHLEQLEQARELEAGAWRQQVGDATRTLNAQLARGDFFLCASDRQRTFWLGQLAALGRLNPDTYEHDPHLDGLIAVAPFGLADEPPVHRRPVLKGVVDGIGPDDKVLLWGGGLYNWFDPLTLIRAVAELAERRDGVCLFFQGTKHPHPGVPEMAIVRASRELAAELGVLDRNVFFNEEWVEYADRENYLTEADAGVSTHHSHIETTFSFRTRILDYLWAGLPMVVTEGDHFGDLVRRAGLGVAVPAGDVGALADGLERVLFDEAFAAASRAAVQAVREEYTWERTLAPLVAFMRDPHRAADSGQAVKLRGPLQAETGFLRDVKTVWRTIRLQGISVTLGKIARRLRRGGRGSR